VRCRFRTAGEGLPPPAAADLWWLPRRSQGTMGEADRQSRAAALRVLRLQNGADSVQCTSGSSAATQ